MNADEHGLGRKVSQLTLKKNNKVLSAFSVKIRPIILWDTDERG